MVKNFENKKLLELLLVWRLFMAGRIKKHIRYYKSKKFLVTSGAGSYPTQIALMFIVKAYDLLGWEPKIELEEGIKTML